MTCKMMAAARDGKPAGDAKPSFQGTLDEDAVLGFKGNDTLDGDGGTDPVDLGAKLAFGDGEGNA